MPGGESLIDPVTGFIYPESWVVACKDGEQLALVASGLGVLTASGKVLRRGFSTGTTAAAACKAAVLSLQGPVDRVVVRTPCGIDVNVPVRASGGRAEATKYPGDYPEDATAGLTFIARAKSRSDGVTLETEDGIGHFTRETPRHRAGEPALSPSALQEIMDTITDGMEMAGIAGIELALAVPGGREAAEKTLNPQLGILGGISILGTTGLVEPWDDHLAGSVMERVAATDRVVVTTGRLGLRYSRLHFPDHEAILVGSRIGEAIGAARGEVILSGLPGLVLKFLFPGILEGTGCLTVEEFSAKPEFLARMEQAFSIARRKYPGVRIVIFSREGVILGDSG